VLAFPCFWALIALAGAETGGLCPDVLGLLGGFVTVVWLWVQWSLAARRWCWRSREPVAALKAFRETRTRYVWRVFGIQLVAILLASIVGVIIEMPFTLIGSAITGDEVNFFLGLRQQRRVDVSRHQRVGQVLASTLTLPVSAGVASLLYMDQRIPA